MQLATLARAAALVAALLVAGTGRAPAAAEAEVKVYRVPAGAAPHDTAPAPGGKIWYTAQGQGALGILDPATGETVQVPLGEGSAPHGVIQGPDGAAWITDGGLNAIVRYDPASGTVMRWALPDGSGNADLNTAAFDHKGTLWFTGQAGVYGRLDPGAGGIKVFPAPHGRGPYGITTTPDGRVFYASLAGSFIAEIDTATGESRRIDPPTRDQGARRVWADPRGDVWVSEWNAGVLSRYTPSTGEWKSWKVPNSPIPHVYAVYVDERGTVWLSDWGTDAVLSFDPAREAFTASYPGSGPDANVRQLNGRPGEVFAAESGLDRIMVIRHGGEPAAAGN